MVGIPLPWEVVSAPLATELATGRETEAWGVGSLESSGAASGGESGWVSLSLSLLPFLPRFEGCWPIWAGVEPGAGECGLDLERREANTESRVGASLSKVRALWSREWSMEVELQQSPIPCLVIVCISLPRFLKPSYPPDRR